jgi:serine/threonine protein kinase/WD40 repeat protein
MRERLFSGRGGSGTLVAYALLIASRRPMQNLGKYVLSRRIGAGGMGVVYEGHDPDLDRPVAIKILPPETGPDADVRRFQSEAKAAAKVSHPNCVSIYDIDEHGGRPFLVMELVRGLNAGQLVERCGPLPWATATRILAAACKGLVAVHAAGLIHRDLKPSNVLVSDTGSVKLADFGLAKVLGQATLSLTGQRTVGTPHFMSPEQCTSESLDARSDIYSLGATYYALLTARPPYLAERDLQVMFAHCNNPTPDPRSRCPDLPASCATIVLKAMAKPPADRFQTAAEMLTALEATLTECGEEVTREIAPDSTSDLARVDSPVITAITSALSKPGSTERDGDAPRKVSRRRLLFAVPPALAALGVGGYFALRKPDEPDKHGPQPPPATPPEPPPTAAAVLLDVGGPVGAVAISDDGRWLVVGLLDGINKRGGVKLFDRQNKNTEAFAVWEKVVCPDVAISPDGRYLAAALGLQREVLVYDTQTGMGVSAKDSALMNGEVRAVAFSPDGKYLAATLVNRTPPEAQRKDFTGIRVWRTDAWGEAPRVLASDGARSLAIAPDGSTLAATVFETDAAGLALWDAASGTRLPMDQTRLSKVIPEQWGDEGATVSFARSRPLLACNSAEVIRLCVAPWLTETIAPFRSRLEPKKLALSPDGSLLVGGVGDLIDLWDTATGKRLMSLRGHDGAVRALAFTADGKTLVSGSSQDSSVRFWNVPAVLAARVEVKDEPPLSPFADGTVWKVGQPAGAVAVSDDSKWVAVGLLGAPEKSEGGVMLFDTATPPPLGSQIWWRWKEHPCRTVAFSPDGRWLAAATETAGRVLVWDMADKKEADWDGLDAKAPVGAVAFSPDGKLFAAALNWWSKPTDQPLVRVWEIANGRGKLLHDLQPGYAPAAGLSFSANSKVLAVAVGSGFGMEAPRAKQIVTLWDVRENRPREGPVFTPGVEVGPHAAFARRAKTLVVTRRDLIDFYPGGDITEDCTQANPKRETMALAVSPDGKLAAAALNGIVLYDTATGNPRGKPLDRHTGATVSMAFTADGRFLLSTGLGDKCVRFWKVPGE